MWRFACIACVVGACKSEKTAVVETSSGSAKPSKGGGFSADLAKSMAMGGSATTGSGAGSETMTGSAMTGSAMTGSAMTGSAMKAGSGSAVATGSAAKAGSGSPVAAGSAAKAGSGSAMAGSAAKAGSGSGSAVAVTPAKPPPPTPTRDPVKPPPELAAIKLSLLPNWERDIGEAGTISFPIKLASGEVRVFVFRYGIEDPAAPVDRDQYKKWLVDNKKLTATLDRQRGAAWMLEGTDGSGVPSFRYLVNFGGKKLICGGSLYKDAESSRLGDLRDQAIIQAKSICETLAL